MKLPGDSEPTVLLSSRSEVEQAQVASIEHPIIFTSKLEKAYGRLRDRGAVARTIRESGGTEIFEISDPEGNVIEVCEEP